MNRPTQQDYESCDLLGYILGALDPQEHEHVEMLIAQDPELRQQLEQIEAQVAPLSGLCPPGPPPAGLARRTCERIAPLSIKPPAVEKSNWFAKRHELLVGNRSWSRGDIVAVALVGILLTAIILPAVNYSKFQSRLTGCENNLRTIGIALLDYSGMHNGRHLEIPRHGNLAVAGSYAALLMDNGQLSNASLFWCPSVRNDDRQLPASCQELLSASGVQLARLQKEVGGDFAFTLGHLDGGKYVAPRNNNREHYVLLADAPSANLAGRTSQNHGGSGQNCFFEDGHIRFLTTPSIDNDSIYENAWGQVAPGTQSDDNVVAPSYTPLMPTD